VFAFALVIALNVTGNAKAQTSIYGGINASNYGFSSNASGNLNYAPTGNSYSFLGDSFGLEGGGTYLFPTQSRLKAGIDLRELYSFGGKGATPVSCPSASPSCPVKIRSRPTCNWAAATFMCRSQVANMSSAMRTEISSRLSVSQA
jgi:hypothetical protein